MDFCKHFMSYVAVPSHAVPNLAPKNTGTRPAMTSLTLPVEPLVYFVIDSILEDFCLLQRCKVQSHLTVLR